MEVNMNLYKGAIIEYCCNICKIINNFTEDFSNKISKIKSESCEHFDIKFIYRIEKIKLKYAISFNCKICGYNELFDILKNPKELSIHYKCKKCNNGDINILMILIEKVIKDDKKGGNLIINDNSVNNFFNNNFEEFNNNYNAINIIFRQTKGATYNFSVSSLNCVFSEVVRNFLKVHKDIDEDKIGAFLFNGERVQDYKTLKENNIKENDIILITEI